MNLPIDDQMSRKRALDPRHSFIVQAPAGSGKTELLTQRFLKLLTRVNRPEEIIAITFTRKAAAEMRHRIVTALEQAHQKLPMEQHKKITASLACDALQHDQLKQWHLLENPSQLRILTIDALSAFLSTKTPILSGFGSNPTIIDRPQKLYTEAAYSLLNSLTQPTSWQPYLKIALLHLDNQAERLVTLLTKMLAKREQWLPHLLRHQKERSKLHEALEHSLHNILTESISKVKNEFPQAQLNDLMALAKKAADNLHVENPEHAFKIFLEEYTVDDHSHAFRYWQQLIHLLLTQDNQWRKKIDKSLGFPPKSTEKESMSALLETLSTHTTLQEHLVHLRLTPPPHYTALQKSMIEALIHLLPILCAELRLIFERYRAIDFVELNLAALRALGNEESPTDLALYLDYQIKHLLIDEFQDTSLTQFSLLQGLTRGWQPQDGRTLFLVGDPMQSIYRFRDAEVGLFLQAELQGINHLPLEKIVLTHNYRSDEKIIHWINETCLQLFPKEADVTRGAIPYCSSIAVNNHLGAAVQCYGLVGYSKAQEALKTIALIKKIQQNNPNDSIALLVRSRSHLSEITELLHAHQLCYHAIDLQPLSQCNFIVDIITLTRALLHREDRIAWYALLRSPVCGLLLTDLQHIAQQSEQNSIWQTLTTAEKLTGLSEDSKRRLERIVAILKHYFNEEGRQPLDLALKSTYEALGYPELAEEQQLRNAERYFELISEWIESHPYFILDEFLQQVNDTFIEPPMGDAKIHVMTIHKAKGLEFDHVLLPGLSHKTKTDEQELLLWLDKPNYQGTFDFVFAPIKHAGDENDAIYTYLKHLESQKLHYESTRVFYVALTRAKKSVHLLATLQKNSAGEIQFNSGSFANFLKESFLANLFFAESDDTLEKSNPIITLKRVPSDWRPTVVNTINPNTPLKNPLPLAQDPYKKIIGTVLHEKIAYPELSIGHRLSQLGIARNQLSNAMQIIQHAFTEMQQDPRAQWLLNPTHEDSHFEYAVSTMINGKVHHLIIDRTFVENGIRWIIDYKTATPEPNENTNDFLEKEWGYYQKQLSTYATALSKLDKRPIKMGLYFPLFRGWIAS